MIEFLIDGGGLIAVNPTHVLYINNDSGQALVHMANGNVFLPSMPYDDFLDMMQRAGVIVHLDKETRDEVDEEYEAAVADQD